jgi:hypothetical protein
MKQTMYRFEARRVEDSSEGAWFDAGLPILPAGQADYCVVSMNKAVPAFVYRKVVTRRRANKAH